jgi:cysteine-rich repeat protein
MKTIGTSRQHAPAAGHGATTRAALGALLVILGATPVAAQCVGDCGGNGAVTVNEIITMVNIALEAAPISACPAGDANMSNTITVNEILAAVNNFLLGCAATPTPTVGMAKCTTVNVTVELVYDVDAVPDLAGLVVDLHYPPTAVGIPGSGFDDTVAERVTDLSGANGFASIQDRDTDADGQDDTLHNVYAATTNIVAGDFEAVRLDCVPGAPAPAADAFSCEVSDTVDSQASPVDGVDCAVRVTTMLVPTPTPNTVHPTPTPQIPTPTPTPGSAVCGNGIVEAGETCDDGNTATNPPNDSCPGDCTIITCTPAESMTRIGVSFTPPTGTNVASLGVLIEYPDGVVQIPGTADDPSVTAAVTNSPSGYLATGFDYDYALSVGLAGTRALTPGNVFTVSFANCQNAAPPAASAFKCTVTDASNTQFHTVSGVTCAVTVQ